LFEVPCSLIAVIHFLGVFSESTSLGLKHYVTTYPAFCETARYIDFITNLWKIMSVKAPYKGNFVTNEYWKNTIFGFFINNLTM